MLQFTDFGLHFSISLQTSAMKQENVAIERDIIISGVK
jgi:hypothetical protein